MSPGKATRLTCRFYDGEEITADLLGADAMTDLAVLRLRLGDRPKKAPPIQTAVFGDSRPGRCRETPALLWVVRPGYPNQ